MSYKTHSYFCMPTLSLYLLLKIKYIQREPVIVFFDIYPRYLRGFRRLLHINEDVLLRVIRNIFRIQIYPIPHGDDLPGYPNLHLLAFQKTSIIADSLNKCLETEDGMELLQILIGQKPAKAYIFKNTAYFYIFPQLLSLLACYHSLEKRKGIVLVLDPGWPEEWYELVKKELMDIPFIFFNWPSWYRKLYTIGFKLRIIMSLPLQSIRWFMSRGIRQISKRPYFNTFMEFIEPARLSGTASDVDYLIDGDRIKSSDMLFFLTRYQSHELSKLGYSLMDIVILFKTKGYHIAILDQLPYSWEFVRNSVVLYFKVIKSFILGGSPVIAYMFYIGWKEFMDFSTLFENYRARNCIFLTFPVGITGVRLNDAIITGLCRSNGIKSIGVQTRAIYNFKYEDCFDCFDFYLSWGPAWHAAFPPRMQFVERTDYIGCIFLDTLLSKFRIENVSEPLEQKINELIVAIFPSDMDYKHHYTKGYAVRFLVNCAHIAEKYPHVHFFLKMKQPIDINPLLENAEFERVFKKVKGNFKFVEATKYEYTKLMQMSDIVIAQGFTTPGAEALMTGKRAIFYSEMPCGGQPYWHLPNLIANNPEELEDIFELSLKDCQSYYSKNLKNIDALDPYRDGQTKQRLVAFLDR